MVCVRECVRVRAVQYGFVSVCANVCCHVSADEDKKKAWFVRLLRVTHTHTVLSSSLGKTIKKKKHAVHA